MAAAQTGLPIDRSEPVNTEHVDDSVLQISGAGHWFLEGWIGDHSVEFLVNSGSSVTAMSDSLYQTLVRAGAPVGMLRSTSRTLRGADGAPIGISGCSHCVVSFMGLQTESPILICHLSTEAIIGTDTLGSVLPHTLDIKNGLLSTDGGVSLQLHRIDTALSGRVFTVGHCSIPPYSEAVLHCTIRTVGRRPMSSSGLLERLTLFVDNTGLVVGRTLDNTHKKILLNGMLRFLCPTSARRLLWSNRAQRLAWWHRYQPNNLSQNLNLDLDGTQQHQLASVLLQYSDLFPVASHTDAVEHEIDFWSQYTYTLCTPPDVRKSKRKKNVSPTCWPVDKLNQVTAHGRHRSS